MVHPNVARIVQLVVVFVTTTTTTTTTVSATATPRIVGGDAVWDATRYPYFTGLFIDEFGDNTYEYKCGATLIWHDVILTAAHCVADYLCYGEKKVEGMNIAAMVNMSKMEVPSDTEFIRETTRFLRHSSYQGFLFLEDDDDLKREVVDQFDVTDDLVLMQLDRPVQGVPHLALNFDPDLGQYDDPVTSIGFGDMNVYADDDQWSTDEVFDRPDRLQEVDLVVMDGEECEETYENSGVLFSQSKMICAGVWGGGQSSCYGDSGGPLIIKGDDHSEDIQVGLVSFGIGCGQPGYWGAYTRISEYENFIKDSICTLSAVRPEYCDVRRRERRWLGALEDLTEAPFHCTVVAHPTISPAPTATPPTPSPGQPQDYKIGDGATAPPSQEISNSLAIEEALNNASGGERAAMSTTNNTVVRIFCLCVGVVMTIASL
eukprot:CAMPEP_0194037042 /NCGR_PEP_ID=MMETSP0009_2-20130614/9394_1 /TAXON_ID=210454 /ORGANISM="Grammatophora oceanica, Strain CCMP 410" /LENGTH=430 /DNA_ID=CAMNT_0038679035 /DNA_START=179 /DNA_END=1471 /DNA_ORIENTATION=-